MNSKLRRYNELGWHALYDTQDRCWLGEDAGVVTFSDEALARVARDVTRIRQRWAVGRIEVRPYDGTGTQHKDDQPNQMTALEALRRKERGSEL